MLKITNQTKESAELYLSGDIIDDSDGACFKREFENTEGYQFPADLKRQLDELKDKDLTIYINSYGGSVPAGVAMANMILRHNGHTTAIVDGFCCSIATQIFFSADTCKIPSNCYLMIHKPEFFAFGAVNADDLRKAADDLDVIQKGLETTYLKKVVDGIKSEDITAMVNAETWLTGQEAAKYFDVEVLDAVKVVNCAGSLEKLKSLKYRNIPKTLKFKDAGSKKPPSILIEQQNKIKSTLARMKGMMTL